MITRTRNNLKRIFKVSILTICLCFIMAISVMAQQQLPTQALNVDGSAEVVDNTNDEGKEFLTVQSRDGNIFYIIIDHQKEENNVYFLNAVDEIDLLSFATDASGNNYHLTGTEIFDTTETTTEVTTEAATETTTGVVAEVEKVSNKSSGGFALAMGVLIICLVILLYFIIKKRFNNNNNVNNEEYDDEKSMEETTDDNTADEDYSKFLDNDDETE